MPVPLADLAERVLAAIDDFELCLGDPNYKFGASEEFQRLAIERSFEIICAAISCLPDSVRELHLHIDWQGMGDLNDRLRDFYYYDNIGAVREIAARNLPALKALSSGIRELRK